MVLLAPGQVGTMSKTESHTYAYNLSLGRKATSTTPSPKPGRWASFKAKATAGGAAGRATVAGLQPEHLQPG